MSINNDVLSNSIFFPFVHKPDYELCVKAVKMDGNNIMYVKNPTDDIKLKAVTQNGMALKHIKKQNIIICVTAINQNILALQFVNKDLLHKVEWEISYGSYGYLTQMIIKPIDYVRKKIFG